MQRKQQEPDTAVWGEKRKNQAWHRKTTDSSCCCNWLFCSNTSLLAGTDLKRQLKLIRILKKYLKGVTGVDKGMGLQVSKMRAGPKLKFGSKHPVLFTPCTSCLSNTSGSTDFRTLLYLLFRTVLDGHPLQHHQNFSLLHPLWKQELMPVPSSWTN